MGVIKQQLKQQNENGGGERNEAGGPPSLLIRSERLSSLAIFANRASCFLHQRSVLVFAMPQEVFLVTQSANQELTTEWLMYSGHDLASLSLSRLTVLLTHVGRVKKKKRKMG